MSQKRVQELREYYPEHTDQELVQAILEALRVGELTNDELVEIGEWISSLPKHRQPAVRDPG